MFKSFFYGLEEVPEARFIELDCNHIFNVKDLDFWMNKEQSLIKYKECPKCKSPVNKSARYMHLINQTLNDINHAKALIIQNDSAINRKFSEVKAYLLEKYKKLEQYSKFYTAKRLSIVNF